MTAMKRRNTGKELKRSENTYKRCVTWNKANGKGYYSKQIERVMLLRT